MESYMTFCVLFIIHFGISCITVKYKYDSSFVSLLNQSYEPLVVMKSNNVMAKDRYKQSKTASTVNENNSQIIPTVSYSNTTQCSESCIDDSVEYFPWKDGVNYEEICKSIQKKLNSFKGPPIIYKGDGGGLGHKFTSLLNVLTTALVVQRPLSCIVNYPSYQ